MNNNDTENIMAKLSEFYAIMRQAEIKYQRQTNSVELVAISKTHSIAAIEAAIAAGQLAFGESYVQEALPKIAALNQLYPNLVWHYVGRIQSNKIKYLATHFHWVQSVTSLEQAEKLSKYRGTCHAQRTLQICIEVNLSAEASKSGVSATEEETIITLAQAIAQLPHLKLRGLMAIPAPTADFALQVASFKQLAAIYYHLQERTQLPLDTLSMGMSADFEAAIAAGASMIRIGTNIFGKRLVSLPL